MAGKWHLPPAVTLNLLRVYQPPLVNLRRHFLFNKALAKVCKRHLITGPRIEMLYLIYTLNGSAVFVSASSLDDWLRRVKRGLHYNKVIERCILLSEHGYLIRNATPGRTYWFKLSLAGVNLLNEFERVLKKERWDR